MFDPRDLDDLVAISRAGSLSGAAKRRGVAVSTVSRRIEALERALKLPLIDRRAGGSTLTRAGAEIAALAEPLADQLARVERAAQSLGAGAERLPVRVTATEFAVSEVLAPALPALLARIDFPVHLQSQGELVSLAGRDADLAIRMARPEGATLHIRKLLDIELGLFASAGYLAGRDPAGIDLAQERLILYDDSYGRIAEASWIGERGLADAVVLRTGSTRAQLQAAVAGAGIALLPVWAARREPSLVALPLAHGIPLRSAWLAVHRDLRREPAIKAVQRWIVEAFAVLRESPSPL